MKFNTEPKYILHLVLIVLAIAGAFHLLGKHFIHTPMSNLLWIFGILYLADNIFEELLGV